MTVQAPELFNCRKGRHRLDVVIVFSGHTSFPGRPVHKGQSEAAAQWVSFRVGGYSELKIELKFK